MKRTLLLFLVVSMTAANAQDLLPELAPAAGKWKANLERLKQDQAAAVTRAQASYVTALDASERAETTKGNVATVAAINKEREALKTGAIGGAFPDGLPKSLQSARRLCAEAVARTEAGFDAQKKRIDGEYLRQLGLLQSKAAASSELAKQIASEKANLLDDPAHPKALVGAWTLHVKAASGAVLNAVRRLEADGTFNGGTWKVEKNRLVLTYSPKVWDAVELPPRGGVMTGKNAGGDVVTLTRE